MSMLNSHRLCRNCGTKFSLIDSHVSKRYCDYECSREYNSKICRIIDDMTRSRVSRMRKEALRIVYEYLELGLSIDETRKEVGLK